MHHFKAVCQMLKNQNKMALLFKNNQKNEQSKSIHDLDMELLVN